MKANVSKDILKQIKLFNKSLSNYKILIKRFIVCLVSDDAVENDNIQFNIYNTTYIRDTIDLNFALYIKDKFFFSDRTYNIIRKLIQPNLPSLHQIKKRRKQLNISLDIKSIDSTDGDVCRFADIKEQLSKRFFNFLNNLDEIELKNIDNLQIKFGADGTNIGKNVFLVNFTFTFLQEDICNSYSGNYCIGVGQIQEKYDCLKEPMYYMFDSIKDFKTFIFKNIEYKIEYFFSADLKFLLEVNGLKSANSNHPCLWCIAHVDDFFKLIFSIHDESHARSEKQCAEALNESQNLKKRK
jgi:hypothetical protein